MAKGQQVKDDFGAMLSLFTGLVRSSWRQLAVIWAVQAVALSVLALFMKNFDSAWPGPFGLGPGILLSAFCLAMAVHRLLWRYGPSLGEAQYVARKAWLTMLAVALISHIAVVIGLMLLIVPGILLSILLMSTPAIIMAERPGILAALQQSIVKTWPLLIPAAGLSLIASFGFIAGLMIMFPELVIASIFGDAVMNAVMQGGFFAMVTLWQALLSVTIYLYVNGRRDQLAVSAPEKLH